LAEESPAHNLRKSKPAVLTMTLPPELLYYCLKGNRSWGLGSVQAVESDTGEARAVGSADGKSSGAPVDAVDPNQLGNWIVTIDLPWCEYPQRASVSRQTAKYLWSLACRCIDLHNAKRKISASSRPFG
jgi:hypothetical protein